MEIPEENDCVIVGGGPAGITAAIYLARFRRNFVIFDTNHSCALKIPLSRNYPGFVHGITGKDILKKLKQQLNSYKIPLIYETVENIIQLDSGKFCVESKKGSVITKNILLATGVEDIEPDLPNIEKGIQQELIHHCPICDGYELINKKIVIIGKGKEGLKEALFIRNYTPHIILVDLENTHWSKYDLQKIKEASVRLVTNPINKMKLNSNALMIYLDEHKIIECDSLYCALGCKKNNALGEGLKAKQKKGLFVVNKDQQTSIPGVFAAGDIVSNVHQLCVAEGQAAIAATAIHNRCRN
ncbi:MAG: NAD(P)/FAD-dependent oxidoreductase [Tatlockia sp.]|nr:NAD(P)/FAD-dependent oxidoreductase [Tatlockia sp.]